MSAGKSFGFAFGKAGAAIGAPSPVVVNELEPVTRARAIGRVSPILSYKAFRLYYNVGICQTESNGIRAYRQ